MLCIKINSQKKDNAFPAAERKKERGTESGEIIYLFKNSLSVQPYHSNDIILGTNTELLKIEWVAKMYRNIPGGNESIKIN